MNTPTISKELLVYLEKLFPDRLPPFPAEQRDLDKRTGQVSVVNHLRHLHETQVATALKQRT